MTDDDAMSLNDAARLTGLTTDALRLRWRRGTLPGYKVGRRLYLYRASLPGVDRWTDRLGDQAAIDWNRSEIELLRGQLAVKDDQIRELHVLLGRLRERLALPAPESPHQRPWWRRWF
jgi:hypothetical protein